ncbi:hypothetical protein Bca101_035172 [Brassica carinata]
MENVTGTDNVGKWSEGFRDPSALNLKKPEKECLTGYAELTQRLTLLRCFYSVHFNILSLLSFPKPI